MLIVTVLKHYFMDFTDKLPVGGYNPSSSFLVFFIFSLLWYDLINYNTNYVTLRLTQVVDYVITLCHMLKKKSYPMVGKIIISYEAIYSVSVGKELCIL